MKQLSALLVVLALQGCMALPFGALAIAITDDACGQCLPRPPK